MPLTRSRTVHSGMLAIPRRIGLAIAHNADTSSWKATPRLQGIYYNEVSLLQVRAFSLVFASYLSQVSKFSRHCIFSMTLTFIVVTIHTLLSAGYLSQLCNPFTPLFCSSFFSYP